MTDREYAIAVTEVLEILKTFSDEDVEKIPKKLIENFETYKLDDYDYKYDYSKPFSKIEMGVNTKAILGVIYRNYWCNEEEKAEYDRILQENQEKRLKKYKVNDLFSKNQEIEKENINSNSEENNIDDTENTSKALIAYDDMKWYQKLKFNIAKFIKKLIGDKNG